MKVSLSLKYKSFNIHETVPSQVVEGGEEDNAECDIDGERVWVVGGQVLHLDVVAWQTIGD